MPIFVYVAYYGTPVLAIIFCLNLVEIIEMVKKDKPIRANAFWMTLSFTIMVWSAVMTMVYASG